MCKPSKPKAPPRLPEAPTLPQVSMTDDELRKRKARAGTNNMGTLLTGPGGTTNTTQGGATLLGGSAPLSGAAPRA